MEQAHGSVKTALVTGSSRGIGEAAALRLAQDGYRVAVVARDSEAVERVVMSLDNKNIGHIGISADLMSPSGRQSLFEQVPPQELDCVVHNLGGSLGISNFWASVDDYSNVWNFNVGVAHELNERVVPAMVSRGVGRLVFVSTLATRLGKGNAPYVVAKAGLEAYIRQLSRELKGSGVVATGVRPGAIRGDIVKTCG
jgi:NAD(P)-dependent dehydrogenase (short-subunit alcohol dehydrogenase family)